MNTLFNKKALSALIAGVLVFAMASVAAAPANTPSPKEQRKLAAEMAKWAKKAPHKTRVICSLQRPSQIQRYYVQCQKKAKSKYLDAGHLDVSVADCCIPGDHWQVKVKVWDKFPNTAVTTSPGPRKKFGVPARVYNYGAGPLRALVECSYLHGVNVFPAGAYLELQSSKGSFCKVTQLKPKADEIDRTP